MLSYLRYFARRSTSVKLPHVNVKRSFYVSIIFSIFIPLILLIGYLFNVSEYNSFNYNNYFILLLIQSIAYAIIVMCSSNLKPSISQYRIMYRLYYLAIFTTLMVLSYNDYRATGNVYFYFVTIIALAIVPAFSMNEFICTYILQTLLIIAFSLCFTYERITILEMVITNLIFLPISAWKYFNVFKNMKLNNKLRSQIDVAETDPLTGLTNRRGLERKVTIAWPFCIRHKVSTAVIMLDIDFFKQYNDTFGHPEGDKCIRKIAEAISQTARRNTDIVARVGGEEFLVFVQEIEKADVVLLAKRIQHNIEELKLKHANRTISEYVTVSIGISYTKLIKSQNTFEQLYTKADYSLYQAKSNGRNCICLDNHIMTRSPKRVNANSRNANVYYQAQKQII